MKKNESSILWQLSQQSQLQHTFCPSPKEKKQPLCQCPNPPIQQNVKNSKNLQSRFIFDIKTTFQLSVLKKKRLEFSVFWEGTHLQFDLIPTEKIKKGMILILIMIMVVAMAVGIFFFIGTKINTAFILWRTRGARSGPVIDSIAIFRL